MDTGWGEMWFGKEGHTHRGLERVWGRTISASPHLDVVGSIFRGDVTPYFYPFAGSGGRTAERPALAQVGGA